MGSVSNITNTNENYHLNAAGENVREIEESASIYTDTAEEVSNSDSIQTYIENLSAEEYVSTLDDTTKEVLIEVLENIVSSEEEALDETKENNGVIAGAWDWIKNKTGIGQGSDKVQTNIDDLKSEIEKLKTDPSKLAEVYEKVTGNELTAGELTSLINGEADFSDSEIVNSVSKYQQGQKQVVNTISSITSGLTMVGLVAAGVVAAPFTAGASLAGAVGLVAAGTAAYMVPQVVDGVTESDGYSASELAQDVATGVVNSAVTAVSLGIGGAAKEGAEVAAANTSKVASVVRQGSSLVSSNTSELAAALGATTETAAELGSKAAGLAVAETASVVMSDGIAAGDYLVEAATNEDVDFSLGTLGTTAASATAAGLAAGATAFGTSSVIRPILTSGTTAASQVAGRLVSSGISGAAAGASATAAAGSTNYLISCSVNGEEVNFDDWLDSTTENMAAGALTGFAAGVGFEAVQVAVGTPAPSGTASRQSGTTEDGLKYTEYLDKDGNVIARDVKVSDIKAYNQNSTEIAEANSNTSSSGIKENFYESTSDPAARTVRFTYNSSNVINENGTVANEYATVNDVQVYNWTDNITFSAAQSSQNTNLQNTNSNVYNDSDIIDADIVEESGNYSSGSDVIIEESGNETVVVENGNVSDNSASVVQDSFAGHDVIIDADTGAIVSDITPSEEITVVSDSVNPFELQVSNLNQITTVDNSSSLTNIVSESSAAQNSSIAAVNAASNYKPSIAANTQNPTAAQNTTTYENLLFETPDGQLALTEVQTPQEELITSEPAQNQPAEPQIEGQLSIDDYVEMEQENILQNSSTEQQSAQLTQKVENQYQSKVNQLRQSAAEIKNEVFQFSDGSTSEFEIYTGTQSGSNYGYYALDKESGTLYYTKYPDNLDQAKVEVLTSKIYGLAHVDTPELTLITNSDGQLGIASKYIEKLDPIYSQNSSVNEGYAVDAYLANWDAVKHGNTAMSSDSAVRVDVGGSLNYRAKGGLKTNFDSTVDEVVTMYENNGDIYGSMTKEDLVSSIKKVTEIDDAELISLLEESDMTQYKDVLLQRKQYLAKYLENLENTVDDGTDMLTMLEDVQAETNSSIAASMADDIGADTAADATARAVSDTVEEASETTAIQSIDDIADDAVVQAADEIGGEQTSSLQSLLDDYKRGMGEIRSQYEKALEKGIREGSVEEYNASEYRYSDKYFDKILDEHMADIDAIVLDENGNIRSCWDLMGNFGTFEEVLQPYEEESPVLYHRTSSTSAESIRSEGFDLARPAVHGAKDGIGGAYFFLEEKPGSYGNSTITAKCSGNLAKADTEILQNIKVAMSTNFESEFGRFDDYTEYLMQKYMQKKAISLGYSGVVGTNNSYRASGQYVTIFNKDAIQIIS